MTVATGCGISGDIYCVAVLGYFDSLCVPSGETVNGNNTGDGLI